MNKGVCGLDDVGDDDNDMGAVESLCRSLASPPPPSTKEDEEDKAS